MSEMLNILVIEDRHADFLMVERHLKLNGLSVRCHRVDCLNGLKEAIKPGGWDLVLSDYNVPQLSFQESLNLLQADLPDVPVIMVTGTVGEEKAVELLKLGVRDFVLKGTLARLVPAVLRSLKEKKEREELRRTAFSLQESEERYRQAQKMEAVGQLAGGVAHDFNNILSAIFGYSQLSLRKLQENDPVKEHVEQILKAAERAAVLTQSLLAFSRKQEVNLAVIDLSNVLKDFEIFLHRLIREDIELTVSCTEELLAVMVDRGQIEQVIMNLVANGRDAMPNGGKLCVETRSVTLDEEFVNAHGYGRAGTYAVISVADSGIGMNKETQSHIFEPFYTTKELGKGTGLGLAMAYGIIKKHDGFINIYSEPGTGTIFKIYLPVVAGVIPADKKDPKEPVALRGGTETILVCEDDAVLRKLAVNVLSHFGYQVIEAIDGQDAIEKFVADKESIDLVFIDAIMPKKNGREASDAMKIVCPDLKTIFVSGYTRDIFAGDSPFDEKTIFIHKPYSPNDLLLKIRELLDNQ
jgi:two-component system, cell cycle sensor histidine kinase and response regulator CckA